MKNNRLTAIIMSTLFCLTICAPLLFTNLKPGSISQSELRYLEEFPQIIDQDGFHFDRAVRLKSWLNDRIGFRETAFELAARLNLLVFHCSPQRSVYVGSQGWYYYTESHNIDIAYGQYPLSEFDLAKIAEMQQATHDALKASGVLYILVLAPSKVSIYPEHVDSVGLRMRETPVDTVARYLEDHTDVTVVNVKPALLNAKDRGQQVYWKTDTHWNETGAYVAYSAVAEAIAARTHRAFCPMTFEKAPLMRTGDLTNIMGAASFMPAEEAEALSILQPAARETPDDPLIGQLGDLYAGTSMQGLPKRFVNPHADSSILLFGDSFFNGVPICSLFAESFGQAVQIPSCSLKKSAVDLIQPDIVVFEITERSISELAWRQLD